MLSFSIIKSKYIVYKNTNGMRFTCLYYNGNKIVDNNTIERKLLSEGLSWLIDCEIENAEIEIKNKTLIWKSGTLYSGLWFYGIWESGTFHGTWESGIWVDGVRRGKIK
jgi:hypothetical protein